MQYKIFDQFKDLWWEAYPLQDAREDAGHAFIVTIYAQHISKIKNLDEKIVVSAAILHDIGWSKLTKEERMLIFDKSNPKEERLKMRYKHQDYGVDLAKPMLEKFKYSNSEINEILEIISQHDTRDGFLSKNEGGMRDADKLWRFDDYGFLNDNQKSKITFEKHFEYLEESLKQDNFLYFDSSAEFAKKQIEKLCQKYMD